ncbi:MAG: hypothetical protein QM753_12065 [Thermomicrobiales bacterium]
MTTPVERMSAYYAEQQADQSTALTPDDLLRRLAAEHPEMVTPVQRMQLGYLQPEATPATATPSTLTDGDIARLAVAIREHAAADQLADLLRADGSGDSIIRALTVALGESAS